MAERVTDIHDVRARIVAELTGQQAPGIPFLMSRSSWAAVDLALTPQPWTPKVIALITSDGGPRHTPLFWLAAWACPLLWRPRA